MMRVEFFSVPIVLLYQTGNDLAAEEWMLLYELEILEINIFSLLSVTK